MKQSDILPPERSPRDEGALVAGCRRRDPVSLDKFFRDYVAYVERVIARLVGPTPDLQDLVQTTFIEAMQSFDRYRGEASLKTWVTRIAVHVSLHQMRAGVRRNVPLELVSPDREPRDPVRAADVQLSEYQLARCLYDLLDRIAAKKRVAFLLYTVEGYSIDEVAALTGASRAAAKSRIWFARRELLAAARHRPELRIFLQPLPTEGQGTTDQQEPPRMALTCKQAIGSSLASSGGHATEAERLWLEEHLAGCQGCAEQHGVAVALVRGLRMVAPGTLTVGAREEVRRALLGGSKHLRTRRIPAPISRMRRALLWGMSVGAAAAVSAAVALWLDVGRFRQPPYQVVAGDVTVSASESSGGSVPARFRSIAGGRVRLADAQVDLAHATEIVWNERQRSLELRAGKVIVDVEHRPGHPFEVRTPRFIVQVLGTRFAVDPTSVTTERGVVRVNDLGGSTLVHLQAGQRWTVGEALAARERVSPRAAVEPLAPASASVGPVEPDRSSGRPSSGGGVAAEKSLGVARRALARGDATAARRIVSPLFREGREIGVEARLLFAEAFLVEGRYADAIDGYRVVVRDFPETSQAESARYAIAELDAEHGRRVDAHAAFQDYLQRYPRGRFAREAADRLTQLSPRER